MSLLMENSVAKIGCGDPGDPIEFGAQFGGGYISGVQPAGNQLKWTVHLEFKKMEVLRSAVSALFGAAQTSGATEYFRFDPQDRFELADGLASTSLFQSALLFRDIAAHGALTFHYDAANADPLERARAYIRGERIEGVVNVALNRPSYINSAVTHAIGQAVGTAGVIGADYRFGGLLSRLILVDDENVDPLEFGYKTYHGSWVHREYSGVFGASGWCRKFDNPAALGGDNSPNGIDFSVVGNVAQVGDTPTNNFSTGNPLDAPAPAGRILSEGNSVWQPGDNPGEGYIASTMSIPEGKFYWEVTPLSGAPFTVSTVIPGIGFAHISVAVNEDDGSVDGLFHYQSNGSTVANPLGIETGYPTWTVNDLISVAIDGTTGDCWFAKNGVWISGNPETGTDPVFTIPSAYLDGLRASVQDSAASGAMSARVNFGQSAFVHQIPDGFTTLSTRGMPCPDILNPKHYVDRRECIGGSGVSDLQFSPLENDVVIISGRRDLETDWRLNYSIAGVLQDPICTNDPAGGPIVGEDGLTLTANGFDVGTATPYQGTCWHRVWRVGGLGRLSITRVNHTGGSTVAAHASGRPIAFGFVIPRAGGDIRTFHHKADAGDYWLLNSNAGFGNDPGWFASSANDLTLGGSLSAGIYDVIGWSEVEQFSSFSKVACNGLIDGPQDLCDYSPLLMFGRKQGAGESNWIMERKANPVTTMQYLSGTTILYSSTGYAIDFNSNGLKWRTNSSSWNPASGFVFTASWADIPGKFATAQ